MKNLSPSEVKRRITLLKEELTKIGWTTADPDGDYQLMNRGPIEHRDRAEHLYKLWRSISNPWNL